MSPWRIVCDIGGTNIRLSRSSTGQVLSHAHITPVRGCASITSLLKQFADQAGELEELDGIAIAAAGPIDDNAVRLTNVALTIDADNISTAFQHRPVRLFNDLEAVALSLPHLTERDREPIIHSSNPHAGGQLAINIGTGFGASLLISTPAGWHAVACEPGHMTLNPPFRSFEAAADASARTSIEDFFSGQAMQEAAAFSRTWDAQLQLRDADLIDFPAILNRPEGPEFLRRYSALLGQVCGDLVLACGAWGGIYFCGSTALAWLRSANLDAFQATFIDKGPMAQRMARVPVSQITAPHPALIGLAHARLN